MHHQRRDKAKPAPVELTVTGLNTFRTRTAFLLLGTAAALALSGCSGRDVETAEKIATANSAAERAELAAARAEKAAGTVEKANAPIVIDGDPDATDDAADADKTDADNGGEEDGPVSTEPTTKT